MRHARGCASLRPGVEKLCNCGAGHAPGSIAAEHLVWSGRDANGRITDMHAAVTYDLGRALAVILWPVAVGLDLVRRIVRPKDHS